MSRFISFPNVLLVVIVLVGFFVRFYQLGEIPLGLNNDEASIGYNAYSILKTGKDEYGITYPVYFESYGDSKMPFYIYATSAVFSVFGVNEFSVRFTSAFFGSLSIIAIYFLVKVLIVRKDVAIVSSFLLAVNPWHLFFSRAGFEVNVATAFLLFGILSFILAIKKKKYLYLYGVLSLLSFVISMYTYNATRVIAPVLFLSLFYFYRNDLGKNALLKGAVFVGLFIICALPLILFSSASIEVENQGSLLITGGETYGKYVEFRGFLYTLPPFISKIFFNIPFLIVWQYLKNIISFFSVDFFFISGASHPINGVTNHGMFYLFEIITIPIGVYTVVKKKVKPLYFFIYWLVITVFLVSITREIPHPTRMYSIVIPLTIISSYGAVSILRTIAGVRSVLFRRVVYSAVFCLCFFSISYYFASYFVYFPLQYAKPWRSEDRALSEYLLSIEPKYERVIINKDSEFLYTSLLFYGKIDPTFVQEEADYRQSGMLKTLEKLGKFEFREIDWGKDRSLPNTIIVSTKDIPQDDRTLKVFTYPMKPVVIYIDGQTQKLDVVDTAYGVFKAN